MTDPRVQALFDEFGIKVVPGNRYPEIGETRAPATVEGILHKHGEDHARWVVRTLAETSNNRALLDETGFRATSNLVQAYWVELHADPEAWFQVFDRLPIGRRQWEIQQRLSGIVNQRAALAGVINQHLYERFHRDHPDLLERAGI